LVPPLLEREEVEVREAMGEKVGMEAKEVMVEWGAMEEDMEAMEEDMEEGMEVICRNPEVCRNPG